MRRIAALLAVVALALLGAGGFAVSEAEPTLPAVRKILNIGLSVKPAELVVPGEVVLTFTITNTSDYDAQNVYIASADGLHIEPLGQIDAGDPQVIFNRQHTVTEDELEEGRISFTLWHDGIAGDQDTVNYTVECPIEKAIAQPGVEFTRQFAGAFARLGEVVTINYRVRNTGNVRLTGLRVSDALGDFTGRVEALEVGEWRLFTSKVTISANAVSHAKLAYTVPAEGDRAYEVELEDARVLLASEQLEATLSLDRGSAISGDTVVATLTLANFGNVDFYDITVTDEVLGGLVADGLEIVNGARPVVIRREYPVRGDMEFQFRVRALSQSGATIEVLTEPVPLAAIAPGDAEISVYARAVYSEIARGGDVPVDVFIVNTGEADLEGASLSEATTGTQLRDFAVIANRATTQRRVFVPVTGTTELVFELSYRGAGGQRRATVSPPVAISVARGGHRLEGGDGDDQPFAGASMKLGQSPVFLFMLIGAGAVLAALSVALWLSSRRIRRARREKMALKKRQRQEELGKTNRFTPVKRPDRKRKEGP